MKLNILGIFLIIFTCLAFAAHSQLATYSVPQVPQVLCQSHIPFVIPSSGSMGNNGALTVTTALPTTYSNAYVQLPANAIQSGSTAGWYYAVFSSTTAATVYQETYSAGSPSIPASPTAWVSTGPGAYTQTNSTVLGPNCNIPGGLLGLNGTIQMQGAESHNNSAGSKTIAGNFSGYLFGSATLTTSATFGFNGGFSNRGVTNKQASLLSYSGFSSTSGTLTPSYGSVDTTIDRTVRISTIMNTPATDYQVIENVIYFFIPGIPN